LTATHAVVLTLVKCVESVMAICIGRPPRGTNIPSSGTVPPGITQTAPPAARMIFPSKKAASRAGPSKRLLEMDSNSGAEVHDVAVAARTRIISRLLSIVLRIRMILS
jgi:hypothetical protein